MKTTALFFAAALAGTLAATSVSAAELTPAEARAIAKEAYVYGFPLVDNYRILHAYAVDTANPEYKAPFNTIKSVARVFTPEDVAIQTPNSDTPYSFLVFDLRAEPIVLTVPKIEKERYFSVQLIDAYTHNFDYIGSRATGNGGGSFLLAGPGWKGETPKGITKAIRSETEIGLAIFRTQLFGSEDLDNVRKIQAGYTVQPLSAFLGQKAPQAAPKVDFAKPLSPEAQKTSLEFYDILNFTLRFCPPHPTEKDLLAKFARIGVGAGKKFDAAGLGPELKQAVEAGMADAWKEFGELQKTDLVTGKVTSGDLFGTREYLKNNYLYRFAAAVLGIYGNSKDEAMYPMYRVDSAGQPLDAAARAYTLHFSPGQFPPANAFWSVTMYNLPQSLLVANPLKRYLINSSMLPKLKHDADGGLTLYIQKDSPGADKEANWLPAPNGPFWMAMRIYWPKAEALNGSWKQPPLLAR